MGVDNLKKEYIQQFDKWLYKSFLGHSVPYKDLLESAKVLMSLDRKFSKSLLSSYQSAKNLYNYE